MARSSWQQGMNIDRRPLMLRFALLLAGNGKARDAIKIIARIFAGAVDQQVFFLIDEVRPLEFAHLEIRGELDGTGRAGFLAKAAENAAREVDAEIVRIPAPGIFGFLQ